VFGIITMENALESILNFNILDEKDYDKKINSLNYSGYGMSDTYVSRIAYNYNN
jgi:hypothetical protein